MRRFEQLFPYMAYRPYMEKAKLKKSAVEITLRMPAPYMKNIKKI